MSTQPFVSVIVPSYNHQSFIRSCIESIVDQDYENLEICIVDDGSKDNSVKVIEETISEIGQKRKINFLNRPNKGVAATLNELLDMAKAEIVLFVASDDKFNAGAISKVVKYLLENSDCVGVAVNADIIDDVGKRVCVNMRGQIVAPSQHAAFDSFLGCKLFGKLFFKKDRDFGTYESFIISNYIGPGFGLRREAIKKAPPYNERLALEDWNYWMNFTKVGRIALLDEPLAAYRVHGDNTIQRNQNRLLEDRATILMSERNYCVTAHRRRFLWLYAWTALLFSLVLRRKFSTARKMLLFLSDVAALPLMIPVFVVTRLGIRPRHGYPRAK